MAPNLEPNFNFPACPKRKAAKRRNKRSGYRNSESSKISNDRELRRQKSQSLMETMNTYKLLDIIYILTI